MTIMHVCRKKRAWLPRKVNNKFICLSTYYRINAWKVFPAEISLEPKLQSTVAASEEDFLALVLTGEKVTDYDLIEKNETWIINES